MCGIYGAIAIENQFDPGIITGLGWANRERGTDSLGYFDTSGRILKKAGDPSRLLATDDFRRWLENSAANTWAIGGHTRHKTQGAATDRNAHPFRYGKVIGSHNGMVHEPDRYAVDSEYLFDTIARGHYTDIGKIAGYWGLSWYDKRDGLFYLTQHSGTLAYAYHGGAVYYSSDPKHLACFVSGEIHKISEGQVIAFDCEGNGYDSENPESGLQPIDASEGYYSGYGYNVGTATGYPRTGRRSGGTSGGASASSGSREMVRYYGASGGACSSGGAGGSFGIYDPDDYSSLYPDSDAETEWREAWETKIHEMSDDDFASWGVDA